MIDNTKKDKEKLLLLLDKIRLYREKQISLPYLISDSEGLILSLDNLTEEFKDEFYSYWGVLEEIYAVNLDRKKDLCKKDKKLIEQTLNNIETIVNKNIQ